MKEKNPLFSIIVPVYNNEQDLNKCIESILLQSYTNFELILVDDGSTDKSPTICDQFADKDNRIHVIHRGNNSGAAKARNVGLAYASGEYIYHVDGDDWISRELLETVGAELEKENAPDIYVFGHIKVMEDGRHIENPMKVEKGLYDKKRLEKEIYPNMICRVEKKIQKGIDSGSLCDKVIRRELLKKHYCRDVNLFQGEDSVCAWECMYYADKICFSESNLYFYNCASTTSGRKKYHADLYENSKAIVEYLRIYLNTEKDSKIEQQIDALEFKGIMRAVQQEISFHHSIYYAARFLRGKSRGEKKICSGEKLPLKVRPYILLLNLHCFHILLLCTIIEFCFKKLAHIINAERY